MDPGLFSKQLARDIKMLYEKNKDKSLKQILCEAVSMNKFTGSSTACLAKITEEGVLKTTNLGDSGYVIWRLEDKSFVKVFRSEEQQYRFNFPY